MLFSFGCYYFFHLLYGIVSPQHSSAQGYPRHSRGKYRLNVVGLDAADGYDGDADALGESFSLVVVKRNGPQPT